MRKELLFSLIRQIPIGRVTTYRLLAIALGNPAAARAVGQVLKQNPNPKTTPCYRVVRSDGKLGGYFGADPKTIQKKACLLRREGVVLTTGHNPRVCNLDAVIFNKFIL